MNIAIVSAHIYIYEGSKDIEILSLVHDDEKGTGIFDDITSALLDQIEPNLDETQDYFFMAIVQSEFIRQFYYDGVEYDVEHVVTEIKSVEDINIQPEGVNA